MKVMFYVVGVLLWVLCSGCSTISVTHDQLPYPANNYTDKITVYSTAAGARPHAIGQRKMPYLAWIPVGAILADKSVNSQMMEDIKGILTNIGYDTSVIRRSDVRTAPTVNCIIRRYGFKNYPMFFPACWWSGRIIVEVQLISVSGQVVWDKEFMAKGMSGGLGGYDQAITQANTNILNYMVDALSSEEFHAALVNAANNTQVMVPLVIKKSRYEKE